MTSMASACSAEPSAEGGRASGPEGTGGAGRADAAGRAAEHASVLDHGFGNLGKSRYPARSRWCSVRGIRGRALAAWLHREGGGPVGGRFLAVGVLGAVGEGGGGEVVLLGADDLQGV